MPPTEPTPSNDATSLSGLISAARQAHPSFKWAVAIGGIAALVAVVSNFGLSPAALVFGAVLFLALMFLFVVFARAASLAKKALSAPALVLIWSFVVLAVVTVVLLLTSTFFNKPIPLRDKILQIQPYSNVSLRVYPKPLEALGEVPGLLSDAEKGTTITFLGIHFANTTDELDDELLAALMRGVSIRYLVLAPSPEIITEYCRQYGQDKDKIRGEIAASFANIERLQSNFERSAQAAAHPGKLEARVLEFVPAQRIYWFDYGVSGSEAIVMQYAMGVRSSDSPALRFAGTSPLGHHYETSINWHWGHGKNYSEWKQAHGTRNG